MSDPKSFFTTSDGEWFKPTAHTRGPWDADLCHAGPPTGLLARAMERAITNKRLTRITVDLIRPIPFDGFRIETTVIREGRSVSTTRAVLIDADNRERVTAAGLHIAEQELQAYPTATVTTPVFANAKTDSFPISKTLHGLPGFNGTGIETRYPPGENPAPGPTTAWLRTVPLLEHETPSAFQRICPLADCGNAFSRNAEPWDVSFVNPDLTLVLHRDPVGEWLGSSTVGHWEPNGQGLADAMLFDTQGPVGRALQTLWLRKNG